MRKNFCVCYNDEICGREFIKYGEAPSAVCPAKPDEAVEKAVAEQPDGENIQKCSRCFMQ